MTQSVKNPPHNEGDAGLIPDQEDPLEKEMATHSSIPTWKVPWTEEPSGLQCMGLQSWTRLKQLSMLACIDIDI